jgi:hypothetical protein
MSLQQTEVVDIFTTEGAVVHALRRTMYDYEWEQLSLDV